MGGYYTKYSLPIFWNIGKIFQNSIFSSLFYVSYFLFGYLILYEVIYMGQERLSMFKIF